MKKTSFLLACLAMCASSIFANPYAYIYNDYKQEVVDLLLKPITGNWYQQHGTANTSSFQSYFEYIQLSKFNSNLNIEFPELRNDELDHSVKMHFAFKDTEFKSEKKIPAILAHSGEEIKIHMIAIKPMTNERVINLAGYDKHIIKFLGEDSKAPVSGMEGVTSYRTTSVEGLNLKDITYTAKRTGATVYAFNYPGIYQSTGKIKEFNDLVNSGIAVVNSLLKDNIHPDDIILDGNSIGAAVALAVRSEFAQNGINLRFFAFNAPTNTKDLICAYKNTNAWFGLKEFYDNICEYYINDEKFVKSIGWYYSLTDNYHSGSPYMTSVNIENDKLLYRSKLIDAIDKMYPYETTSAQSTQWSLDYNTLKDVSSIKANVHLAEKNKRLYDTHYIHYFQTTNIFEYLNTYIVLSDKALRSSRETRDIDMNKHKLPGALPSYINCI